MNLLLVAATRPEIQPMLEELALTLGENRKQGHRVFVLVTGVGMVATAFAMGRVLHERFDLAVNFGIAGSFSADHAPGEVVEVVQDTLTELGAEDRERFIALPELGLGESSFGPVRPPSSLPLALRKVRGITVNTVHGHAPSIAAIRQRIEAVTESMEGAAFFYACGIAGVPGVQVRAISNFVEPRNRDAWNIPLAIKNLNTFAGKFIPALLAPQAEL